MSNGIHQLRLTGGPAGDAEEVVVRGPGGGVTLPTFVSADGTRSVRFRTSEAGDYEVRLPNGDAGKGATFETVAIDSAAAVSPAPHVTRNGRRLVDENGAPFLWLADTWWFALCDRVEPRELAELAAQRKEEGYSVVQVVAGLVPEVNAFDPLGDLAGVWPWTKDFSGLEPRWWDAADARVAAIVEAGLVPTIVGGWSYYMIDMGRERLERHWREIIARWSALPVIWCIAGEAGLPHYEDMFAPDIDARVAHLTADWSAIAGMVRRVDPYQNLRTIHPCPVFGHLSSSDSLGAGVSDLDLIWMQTGHADRSVIPSTMDAIHRELAHEHGLPVVNSEVCYEGIAAGSEASLQRFLFWSHVLSGTAGHTYGAQGVWAFHRSQDPGPGVAWGAMAWQDAAKFPGGKQLGKAANLLRSFDWENLKPSPETLSIHSNAEVPNLSYAARSEDHVVAYFPPGSILPPGIGINSDLARVGISFDFERVFVRGLQKGDWDFSWWNPRTGSELESTTVTIGDDGERLLSSQVAAGALTAGSLPSREDWIFIASRRS